jgi:ubiquitin fusion degradation protein 1
MSFELQVKSIAFYSGISSSIELENSNKVILPISVLNQLSNEHKDNLVYPLVFKVEDEKGVVFAVGVKDFSNNEPYIYLPKRLMDINWLPYDSTVTLTYITPPKGQLIKLQPHKTAFTMLSNPKEILEKGIIENYPVLTCGETISVSYDGEIYLINVLESKPEHIISTFNTDLSVDFAPPLDYEEYQRNQKKKLERTVNIGINRYPEGKESIEPIEKTESFVAFSGKGYKLGN